MCPETGRRDLAVAGPAPMSIARPDGGIVVSDKDEVVIPYPARAD